MDATPEALAEWERKFWDRVDVREPHECWNWIGHAQRRSSCGYGLFNVHSRAMRAHRASWIIHNGTIQRGQFVCHSCDNRRCVNPSHLFLGTPLDNSRDAASKSRLRPPRGSEQRTAKLAETDIVAILQRRMAGDSISAIARDYDVATSLVVNICQRKAWRHVPADWYVAPPKRTWRNRRSAALKTHCSSGHEYTPDNTVITSLGARRCRICRNASARKHNSAHVKRMDAEWRARNKAAA